MMKIIKLDTEDKFKSLKEGDLLLVKWKERESWCNGMLGIMLYKLPSSNCGHPHDIVLRKKGNHYFNYMMYLEGKSIAEEIYEVRV